MKQVIFDSSFLMAVVENPTTWYEDIVDEMGRFQPILLDCVRSELEKLRGGQSARARAARVGLDMALKFVRLPCGGSRVDDEILSAALTSKAAVATTDGELARSLKASHVQVITLRGGRVAFPIS